MKRIVVTGERQCELADVADPNVAERYAKIKIFAAPLCTEFNQFVAGREGPLGGHEAAGEVVDVGPAVTMVKKGDRVVVMPQSGCGVCSLCTAGEHIYCPNKRDPRKICHSETGTSTYAQYCIQQDWLLLPIPDDLSYDHASMACCGLGPAFNAMQCMNVQSTDTVLVSGLGPVGLGAAVLACYRGARVLATEMNPYRIELAKSIGVEAVVDPTSEDAVEHLLDLTDGKGADKSIETCSSQGAPAFLVKVARRKGQVAFVGWGGPLEAAALVGKGLTVHGCWHWNHQRDGEAMLTTIREARHLISKQITHTFPFSEVQEALETRAGGDCGKIILHPWED